MENINIVINFVEENWSAFNYRCEEAGEKAEDVLKELQVVSEGLTAYEQGYKKAVSDYIYSPLCKND